MPNHMPDGNTDQKTASGMLKQRTESLFPSMHALVLRFLLFVLSPGLSCKIVKSLSFHIKFHKVKSCSYQNYFNLYAINLTRL